MDFLNTAGAKANIVRYLKNEQKEQLLAQAITELNKYLKTFDLPLLYATGDLISKKYSKDELERKLLIILDKKDSYSQLIKFVYPKEFALKKVIPASPKLVVKDLQALKDSMAVVVDGDILINYIFCHECMPKPGTKIVAKTGRDGIRIHSLECS